MKLKLALLFLAAVCAQAQTRNVVLTWAASTSTGITGYAVFAGVGAATPVQIGCVGVVAGSTCVTGSTAGTTSYTDSQTTGTSVTYYVVSVAAACTPTTPVGQGCGQSGPSTSVTTTVPPKPTSISTIQVTVP